MPPLRNQSGHFLFMADEIKTTTTLDEGTEGLSAIDKLALGAPFADEEEPAAEETKPEDTSSGKSDVGLSVLNERLSKAEERAFAAEQRAQFTAGQLALLRQEKQPKAEEPKRFQFNKDEFAAALEKDPAQAIHDLVSNLAEDKARGVGREVEGRVDNRFGQIGQQGARAQRFEQDRTKVHSKYGELAKSPEFIAAADRTIVEIVQMRTGKEASDITQADLQPGDLFAAASAVYGDWAANGKLPKAAPAAERQARPLREIIASAPKNESFDNPGGRGAKNGSVGLSDLYKADEIPAVHKLMKEFGITKESDWVAHMVAAGKEDESYAR